MDSKIREIIRFILNMNKEEYTDNKLFIEINDTNILQGGNIKIDATGLWVKDFQIDKFKVWNRFRQNIFIHFGVNNTKSYYLYKINKSVKIELEEEPFIKDCDYYLSFVFFVSNRVLRSKFPVIKKYFESVAKNHLDIKINLSASDKFWNEDKDIQKSVELIDKCINNMILYDTTGNFRDKVLEDLGVSTNESAITEINKRIHLLLFKSTDDFDD